MPTRKLEDQNQMLNLELSITANTESLQFHESKITVIHDQVIQMCKHVLLVRNLTNLKVVASLQICHLKIVSR